MSRIAKKPVLLASGVAVELQPGMIVIKGPKGSLVLKLHSLVVVKKEATELNVSALNESHESVALSGTVRALLHNMVHGVSVGYEKKLELVGVGYRAAVAGKKLNLTLGYSHPVAFDIPVGITITTPDQTHITIAGADKNLVGQVAATIRRFRAPEPYKGKGVKYEGEKIKIKETKKK